MSITEAIILAGGMGTRLRKAVSDVPKPMAPVGDRPFLAYLLEDLKNQKIQHVVLSVGYQYEVIQNYFGVEYQGIQISYSIENQPLGTGGGILLALEKCVQDDIFILNGDTFFKVNLSKLAAFHHRTKADLSIALKKMTHFDRYGIVQTDGDKIVQFEEKKYCLEGYINGGIYALNKRFISKQNLPKKFSFEKEILERDLGQYCAFKGAIDAYFMDIGIPADYFKFQADIANI
ncbi:MAG: D-glycero-alpha-D-manno-heptose 1-phosphate guanylyltransferase [Bacteroidota bacterium]|jgi:D-glycero-alpha-D-manno-heptose 1-phosphate guanylyltransferase